MTKFAKYFSYEKDYSYFQKLNYENIEKTADILTNQWHTDQAFWFRETREIKHKGRYKMISKYKNVAVIYGGKGRNYAEALHKSILKISDEERYPICSKLIMEP